MPRHEQPQRLDLAAAGVGRRLQFECLDLLEQDGNRLFEVEGLSWHAASALQGATARADGPMNERTR
jgi:hypothetical protein